MNRDLLHDLYLKQIQALYEAVDRMPQAEPPPSLVEAGPATGRRSPKSRGSRSNVSRQRDEALARRSVSARSRRGR